MITHQAESFSECLDELRALFRLHWNELVEFDDFPFDPDEQFYCLSPAVRLFTARLEGDVIGYAIFFVSNNKHSKSILNAAQDALYLLPEYRGTGHGRRFVEFCTEQLMNEGCQVVWVTTKPRNSFAPMLEGIGFSVVETVYAKRSR